MSVWWMDRPAEAIAAVAGIMARLREVDLTGVQIEGPVPGQVNATLACPKCSARDWFPWKASGRMRGHCRPCGFDFPIKPRRRHDA